MWCAAGTGDELVINELIFSGSFNDLDVPVMVALMSCLVTQEHGDESEMRLKDELQGPFRQSRCWVKTTN